MILRLLDGFNRSAPNAGRLIDFVAGPVPGWYTVTSGRGAPAGASVTARTPETLRDYFAARHRAGEKLELRELRVDRDGGLGQIEYRMRRRAGDLAGGAWLRVDGKGAIACAPPSLVAASMSVVDPGERTGPLCPGRGGAVVGRSSPARDLERHQSRGGSGERP